jgi:hypothetical protein
MKINISYAVFGINLKHLRRSQWFHVVAERASDGSFHWAFAGLFNQQKPRREIP